VYFFAIQSINCGKSNFSGMQARFFIRSFAAIFCRILFAATPVFAQQPFIRQINYPYQIATQKIYDLKTYEDGLLWLGTEQGLFAFNGKKARQIPILSSRQPDFTHLKRDGWQRLWGMNFANQLFYLEQDTLRWFQATETLGITGNLINFDFTDSCIWVLTDQMVLAIHLRKLTLEHQVHAGPGNQFLSMQAYQGQIHVLLEGQDWILDEKNGLQQKLSVCLTQAGRFGIHKGYLVVTHRDNFSRKACYFTNGKWESLPALQLPSDKVLYHLAASASDELWLCTKHGGWLWDPFTGRAELLFPNLQVTGVVKDFQGNYWVSTLDDGLWQCPSLQVVQYQPFPELEAAKIFISRFYPSDHPGRFWLCMANGQVVEITPGKPGAHLVLETQYKKEVTSFAIHPAKSYYLTSSGVFSRTGQLMKDLPIAKSLVLHNDSLVLNARSSTAEWLLPFHSAKTGEAPDTLFGIPLHKESTKIFGFPAYLMRNQRSYSVCTDPVGGKYWVGYADGLYEYDFHGNFKKLLTPNGEPVIARRLCLDHMGRLYAGTFEQGLLVWQDGKLIGQLGGGQVLKGREVRKLEAVADTVWVGTEEEIGFLSYENTVFTNLLGQNRLSSLNYQDFVHTHDAVWVAMEGKILRLPRSAASTLPGLKMRMAQTYQQDEAVLVMLEALSFQNPQRTRIFYRLSHDREWSFADDLSLTIRYGHLPPGTFTLQYYAEDLLSGTSSETMSVTFAIPRPWWATWWAFLLYGLGFVLLAVLIFRWWVERYKRILYRRETLWMSQLKAIKAQMNPHFLYNILNTVQGLVYSNQKTEAAELLGKFSDLMRKTLESSEIPYVTIRDEIELLKLYLNLESSRFRGSNFSYELSYQTMLDKLDHEIPSLLIQPFVENALKHGLLHKKGERRLKVLFEPAAEGFQVVIEDNGIGRKKSAELGQRRGYKVKDFTMSASRQRIDLINNMRRYKVSLQVEDLFDEAQQQPLGTRVTLLVAGAVEKKWPAAFLVSENRLTSLTE
jgi:ligand-binding sensor domain-containing protein